MLVEVPVSSMKTSLVGSSRGCRCFQLARATRTSSRSCSAARRLFFEADVVPIEEPPHHTGADHDTVLPQLAADFLQRQIRLRSNQSQQQLLVRIHRRSFAPYRLGRHRPGPPPQRNPPDRGARADLKDGSRFSARGPRLNSTNHPLTQVLGIGPRHRSSPESFDPARLAYPSEFENPFLSDTDSNRWDCALELKRAKPAKPENKSFFIDSPLREEESDSILTPVGPLGCVLGATVCRKITALLLVSASSRAQARPKHLPGRLLHVGPLPG